MFTKHAVSTFRTWQLLLLWIYSVSSKNIISECWGSIFIISIHNTYSRILAHTRIHTVLMFYFPSSDILKCSSSNISTEACWAVPYPSAVHRLWGYCSHYIFPVKSDSTVATPFMATRTVLFVPTLKENVLTKEEKKKEDTLFP